MITQPENPSLLTSREHYTLTGTVQSKSMDKPHAPAFVEVAANPMRDPAASSTATSRAGQIGPSRLTVVRSNLTHRHRRRWFSGSTVVAGSQRRKSVELGEF